MGTPPIQMANIGMADTLILMVMALVVFGPRRLPQIGRQIGKLMYEFRKASNDFKFQMEEELRLAEDADRRKAEEARIKALAAATPAPAEVAVTPVPAIATEVVSDSAPPEPPASEDSFTGDAVVATPAAEEAGLRIQPPSTGVPVAAARPNSAALQNGHVAQESLPFGESTPVEEAPQEQPTHHG